jgi:copper chaperone
MCKTCGCHGTHLEKIVLNVQGMNCAHCKNAIEKAVRGLPGVMSGEVKLTAKILTVEFDSTKTRLNDITDAIEDAGFSVV